MPEQYDEISLLEAACAGCRVALGGLHDHYAGLVKALCLDATGRMHDAEDLTQEVFLRAFKQLDTLRDTSKFGPWLVGITRLVIKEWYRARQRDCSGTGYEPGSIGSSSDVVEAADEFAHLHSLIAQLGENERMALHLFYLQEHPVEAARTIMGLSRSGFYRVLQRAKNQLANHLSATARVGNEPLDR